MPLVLVKNIECSNCDAQTPLLAPILEEKLGYRLGPSNYGIEIFFACPHCNLVGQATISPQARSIAIEEGQRHPGGRVPFRVLLEYAQRNCESRIEVLGTAKADSDQTKVPMLCRTWRFGREVQCEEMHHPMNPIEIASLLWD